jgi:ketosteroid isomerase-like protein
MFMSNSQTVSLLRTVFIFVIAFLTASCGGVETTPTDIVAHYYSAIKEGDANNAASFFADEAVIITPSGNVITGIDAIKGKFIPYDLQYMDHVEFLTDFTANNGTLSWSQVWHDYNGDTLENECEVTVENGKIVEWIFK